MFCKKYVKISAFKGIMITYLIEISAVLNKSGLDAVPWLFYNNNNCQFRRKMWCLEHIRWELSFILYDKNNS
jgi:hypothetical protein